MPYAFHPSHGDNFDLDGDSIIGWGEDGAGSFVECENDDCVYVVRENGVEDPQSDMDESMDGDFDTAMSSAGYGTDEDYGDYGQSEYDGGDYPSSDCDSPLADLD